MNENSKDDQENFSEKLTDILNYGALNLAMGIGYRIRLFDVMDTFKTPQPAAVISQKAGLNERYVLEWLGVMATGGIVELVKDERGRDLFHLPKTHADLITRRAGNKNMGVYTQEIPLLTATVSEAVENGFKTGEGIHYDQYPGFYRFMTELADAKHRQVLASQFLPSVENGEMVRRLDQGISVCDMGCGEGVALMVMAEAFPKSRFFGIDISDGVIEKARSSAEEQGFQNLTFQKCDAALLTENRELHDTFDYVTAFDAIHDQTKTRRSPRRHFCRFKKWGCFFNGRHCRQQRPGKKYGPPHGDVPLHGQSYALHAGGSYRRRHGTRHDVGTGKSR